MPTTDPVFGWPIAQGSDPAKQYPAAVDQPFKAALSQDLQDLRNPPHARVNVGGQSIAASGPLTLTGGVQVAQGGATVSGGRITVPVGGLYLVTIEGTASGATAGLHFRLGFGNTTDTAWFYGAITLHAGIGASSSLSAVWDLPADTYAIWSDSGSAYTGVFLFTVTWMSDSTAAAQTPGRPIPPAPIGEGK